MALSVVDICNDALLKLGHSPIISLDNPQGEEGLAIGKPTKVTLLNAFYPKVRDAVLRAYPWNCAIERQQLSRLVETPAFGFTYQFQLPQDPYCLRVLKLDDEEAVYKIEGRKLLCDNGTVKIKYISQVIDVALFDSLLSEAITARLSAELDYPITGSTSHSGAMWQLYEAKLREARTMDGMEGTVDQYESNQLIDVR